jgi:hypothetical protein
MGKVMGTLYYEIGDVANLNNISYRYHLSRASGLNSLSFFQNTLIIAKFKCFFLTRINGYRAWRRKASHRVMGDVMGDVGTLSLNSFQAFDI